MTKRDDGGPAFPALSMPGGVGMSLRDYFAAAAIDRAATIEAIERVDFDSSTWDSARIAKLAYVIADAMLWERNKK